MRSLWSHHPSSLSIIWRYKCWSTLTSQAHKNSISAPWTSTCYEHSTFQATWSQIKQNWWLYKWVNATKRLSILKLHEARAKNCRFFTHQNCFLGMTEYGSVQPHPFLTCCHQCNSSFLFHVDQNMITGTIRWKPWMKRYKTTYTRVTVLRKKRP